MEINETFIKGCFEIQPRVLSDDRGRFVKPFHAESLLNAGIEFNVQEEYYSVSKTNVLRGLHFQLPPAGTAKLVTCLQGEIFDAVVDLRKGSPTYLQHFHIRLSAEKGNAIFIPVGLAHGFCVEKEEATVLYMSSGVFSGEHDSGIRWDSAGVPWPLENPVISERDKSLVQLDDFKTPF